ncbi:hypothetical protein Tsubulata_035082 [Turnera subulata]|uniref:At4g14310 8-bladed propeller domain-containing protein n=1 Tax=Turnera subulata TaxID=218843 RepID=A0A9Q0FV90_9ROSI|nr:hypothetical protein Tsubulata_035082 [Turnera subulata]
MSASATRRLKDRNGVIPAAAAQKPTRTGTPISASNKEPSSALKRSHSGKEKPGPNLRAQRPAIKAVPRFDKAAASAGASGSDGGGGEGRMRWSTSSVPRGRCSSPTEFIRVFRDSRVSNGDGENRAVSAGRKSGSRTFRDGKENGGFSVGSVKKSGTCGSSDGKSEGKLTVSRVSRGNCDKEEKFSSDSMKPSGFDSQPKSSLVPKVSTGVTDKLCTEKSGSNGLRKSGEKSDCKAKVLENLKEKGSIEDGSGNRVGGKYPSKLHEKLAFLEGKVKRIATDIKKTKEMLDMNNPDASKLILTDIQDKISGIEKAMGNVVGDSSKSGGRDCKENTVVDKCEGKVGDGAKSLIKGLNNEELEARLLPHEKLLRDRTTLKSLLGSSQSHDASSAAELGTKLKVGQKLLSPVEENQIALEFLASLGKDGIVGDANVGLESRQVQGMDDSATSGKNSSSNMFAGKCEEELVLTTDEAFDEFDDQENGATVVGEEIEDTCNHPVNEIGPKSSTGGWFVSEGESVLLAHDDGSCSFYDIANCEEKAVYKPPAGISPNIWRDCWVIRAPGADGCSGRYVVAASAGNSLDSGFCSWDFYTKDVQAFHTDDGGTAASRTILGPLPNATYRRTTLSGTLLPENQQWWYKPCGPLMTSTASNAKIVQIHDIRDGEQIMKWEVQKPVLAMDYSSPLQWRNRGKVVIAETETISVWDVNSISPLSLLSISSSGRKISALHVVNTDAELGGGVRQRVTSAEAEGNDGVFCTPDSINVLDFRHPSGIGLKIPKIGVSAQSVFTRGDAVYLGCTNTRCAGKKQPTSQLQHFSLRKQKPISTYSLPDADAHSHHSAIAQVWGNSNLVMAISGLGLFVFDALKDDGALSVAVDHDNVQKVKEVIGPDDLYAPSFDYLASRVLLISRDRPALWKQI